MIQVGKRDLRQKLGYYIEMAKSGQEVAITDHGRVIARLVPAPPGIEGRVAALQAAGVISWSGGRLGPAQPVARLLGTKQVAELVAEMRE